MIASFRLQYVSAIYMILVHDNDSTCEWRGDGAEAAGFGRQAADGGAAVAQMAVVARRAAAVQIFCKVMREATDTTGAREKTRATVRDGTFVGYAWYIH
jgi:hypothetical protein